MANSIAILHRLIELDYQGEDKTIKKVVDGMSYADLSYLSAMFKRLADEAAKQPTPNEKFLFDEMFQ